MAKTATIMSQFWGLRIGADLSRATLQPHMALNVVPVWSSGGGRAGPRPLSSHSWCVGRDGSAGSLLFTDSRGFSPSSLLQGSQTSQHMETACPYRPGLNRAQHHSSLLHRPKQSEAKIHREEKQTLISHWRGCERICSSFPSTRECYQNYFVHLM